MVARLEVEGGWFADLADDDRVLLGHPFGSVRIGDVGQLQRQLAEPFLDPLQLLFRRLDPLLQALDGRHQLLGLGVFPRSFALADLPGKRLALGLRVLDLGQQLPPARVESQQLVDLLGGAAARQRGFDPLGIGADRLQVQHGKPALTEIPGRGGARIPRLPRRTWPRIWRRPSLRRRRRCSGA
jgi:hypothetical protein